MDGNGRWAKERGKSRVAGHDKGAEVVKDITSHCSKIGIKYLTLYAFSTENWKRPKTEVSFLMKLLNKYLNNELKTYMENDTKFETIGDISRFPISLQDTIKKVKEKTKHNKGLTQILALNYGSRDEIVRAVNSLIKDDIKVTEESLDNALDTGIFPEIDLLIRTSGEIRLSNFLLWQLAYSEFIFTDTLWPDFNADELDSIIKDFSNRERRFGAV